MSYQTVKESQRATKHRGIRGVKHGVTKEPRTGTTNERLRQ